MTDSVEGGRRAGNEEHFIYSLKQEGEYEELAAPDSFSLSLFLFQSYQTLSSSFSAN